METFFEGYILTLKKPVQYVVIGELELEVPHGIRMESMGNLFGCEGWGITW